MWPPGSAPAWLASAQLGVRREARHVWCLGNGEEGRAAQLGDDTCLPHHPSPAPSSGPTASPPTNNAAAVSACKSQPGPVQVSEGPALWGPRNPAGLLEPFPGTQELCSPAPPQGPGVLPRHLSLYCVIPSAIQSPLTPLACGSVN